MTSNCSPNYKRAPSLRLQQHLAPDGLLASILLPRRVTGINLEVHFRSGDEVHLYCGLTCLLKSKLCRGGHVWVESHKTYASAPYAKLGVRFPEFANQLFRALPFSTPPILLKSSSVSEEIFQ